ncbi:Canalicular multispecific organic anion transporter 2 [Tolypocladium paradoxum]|uniref:Canalicular multispecific organic anion transporter 2 n=1 Tax=Tolypocladium paradoxum TaxID=94208 RepID=A0A2S4L8T4_9HYPO|nr:Canalicular multispecific organic anion transporter 2 [Tolypocladium paradoxum]
MSLPGVPCSIAVEDVFGPAVADSCVGGFDFTLLFEEGILTTLPLGIALGWAVLRLLALRNEAAKVRSSWLLALKLVVLLALWVSRGVLTTRLTFACIALTIAGYSILSVVSYLEHVRSVRPSSLLSVYLGVSILLDLARVRTLFFVPESRTVAAVLLASFCTKILVFTLEVTEKRHLLLVEWQDESPEATSGVINRALFIWVNAVFIRGFRTLLTVNTLTPLDAEILSASRPATLIERWERTKKSSQHALLRTFLIHYKWSILAGVLPRLAYAGFSFSQPFLVQRVLDFTVESDELNTQNTAYGLIAAYAITYIGLSLAYAVYQHKTYRLLTLFRGSLVTLIFGKTLRIDSSVIADAEAITLMSADIDRIGSSMPIIHEMYASFIEAGLALWLLYRLLGVAVVAPIVWIIVCLVLGLPLAKAAGNAQTPWLEAIEDRLEATAKALGSMKAIKMTGLADIVSSKIANLRLSEIRASRRHRILNIFVFIAYFASSALAPVWGYTVYILLAKANNSGTLTEGVAFASLSLFELLNQPMTYAIDGYEHIQTVINSFRRIQKYLMSKEREDYRTTPMSNKPPSDSTLQESDEKPLKEFPSSEPANPKFTAIVKDASASYAKEDEPVLKNLNFNIPRGQTTMIFGPVGSGKSTLLKLLLGEMPFTTGLVSTTFLRAAYCPQTPWTTWGTVQSNIVGMSVFERSWYDTVVHACALLADFEELSNGDQTNTGTRGSRLSGGQQMRVSFARALYSRNPIMILDDVLTGLDRSTERHILDAVFGPEGLLKMFNSTVILTTNSGKSFHQSLACKLLTVTANHLSFADYVIFLDQEGQIARQGTRESLSDADEELQKLASQPPTTTSRPKLEIPEDALHELEMLEDPNPGDHRHAGDMKVYAYYANIAGWWTISLYLFACATFVFGVTFPSVWLQWWTNANADHPNERISYWLGVYGALAAVTILGCTVAD